MAPPPVTLSHRLYNAAIDAASPAITLYLWQRALRGIDRWDRLQERHGVPSVHRRPRGPVFWFHGASIGECAMAVGIVEKCLHDMPYATVLVTTQDTLALSFIERTFPKNLVICQYAPIDSRGAVERFLQFWKPFCVVLMESELWPNLMLSPLLDDVRLGILNARMSAASFHRWSGATPLAAAMLSRVTLLTTAHSVQGLQFQLLGVNPSAVHYTGDLKFATQGVLEKRGAVQVDKLRQQIGKRKFWLAASTHAGEEEMVALIHQSFHEALPDLLTIIAPRHPQRRNAIVKMLQSRGLAVALHSRRQPITPQTQVYLADTTGEMELWYSLSHLAFVGGSMVQGVGGHNLAEPAFCSCAVLVGPHATNFQRMVDEMQRTAPLSIWQVQNETELRQAVGELLGNEAKLNARCIAAKRASAVASDGVVIGVWEHVRSALLSGSEPGRNSEAPLKEDGPDAELSPILHKQLLRSESEIAPESSKRQLQMDHSANGSMKPKGFGASKTLNMR